MPTLSNQKHVTPPTATHDAFNASELNRNITTGNDTVSLLNTTPLPLVSQLTWHTCECVEDGMEGEDSKGDVWEFGGHVGDVFGVVLEG